MKKYLWFFLFLLSLQINGQINLPSIRPSQKNGNKSKIDSVAFNKDSVIVRIKTKPINEYKKFNILNDTISADTSLTIQHYYRFNEFLMDNFLLIPFHNYGQPVNKLYLYHLPKNILPGFVAETKNNADWTHDQIPFFKTPTPYSDLIYMNGVSQGQILNATFATNIYKNLNIAAGYRGLSSLGLYKNSISSSGRFFGSINYQNKKYKLWFYYYTYNLKNEENGGLKNPLQFESGDDNFKDRGRIEVNLSNTDNELKTKRLFIGQEYEVINKIKIKNDFIYEKKSYEFLQQSPEPILGNTFFNGAFKDSIYLKKIENYSAVTFKTKFFNLASGIKFIHQTYGTDSTKIVNVNIIPAQLKYTDFTWDNQLLFEKEKFKLKSKFELGFTSNLSGYFFDTKADYQLNKQSKISAQLISSSKRPDFKYILFQSNYQNFNWHNPEFENEHNHSLSVTWKNNKWGSLKLKQHIINNYTYFNTDSLPHQNKKGIKYTSVTYQKEWSYKKWGFITDIHLQNVTTGKEIYPLPHYVFRSSIFFSNRYYNGNLFVQTGMDFRYFESYFGPAYNPITSDFLLQNFQKIGPYPWVDYFFNFKVKRFRFYFKLEHLNALFVSKPNYYAVPLQPTRDFSIRYGLRWIFLN